MINRLSWQQFFTPEQSYFAAGYEVGAMRREAAGHTHDFAEIFLLDAPELEHNLNGQVATLSSGTLVLIRPDDFHQLYPARHPAAGRLLNVAFRAAVLDHADPRLTALWQTAAGRHTTLPSEGVAALKLIHEALERDRAARCTTLQYFLSAVTYWWLETLPVPNPDPASIPVPAWLAAALYRAELQEPPPSRRQFVRWCARCPAHVNRAMQIARAQSTTAYLSALALDYAAKRLTRSDEAIAAIAREAGYQHDSSFQRAFRARFHTSPRHYRLAQRKILS